VFGYWSGKVQICIEAITRGFINLFLAFKTDFFLEHYFIARYII